MREIEQDERQKKKEKKGRNFLGGRKIGPKCLGACRSRECPNIDLGALFSRHKVRERNPGGYIFPTPDREIDWAKRRFPRKMRHRG
ncbi:uncharacterized protein TNIN_78611 [Trichonephila inaurata madagascariensis]|uniref:Uncharacterized protein n=1 Tax=Trichonephila inaurata madagascariensis TaxID=2747483 RepID=A0A8X7C5B5_9ARAC|nr:uncharacterized protein TNIN_78611 [Trichonephila inaurata madagascariensis]